ncbi:protein kinase [Kitasatospora sp. NPDC093550]|uniref:serine/threonine-protein kinase n=1 Tax=Kitasatospora sp. NPDC093550 TaxID=3364089 RepID=UPI0037F9C5E3
MALLENDPREIGGYRLEDRLGAGGMGVVYRARSLSGRQVAVKVIRAELATDAEFRARFRHEVTAARLVSGAFTAPVIDADADATTPWLATLYIPGPSLAQRVATQGPFSPAEVRRLAAGLAEALQDIHRVGLVHRDLKPGNVLLAEDGPRVIDFGIARALDGTQLTSTGVAVGTPPFMAPEQFRDGTAGPATDMFALGSVLVFAATGRGPFGGDSSHAVGYRVVHEEPDLTGVPAELLPLITACLAKDPAARPTVDQLLRRLAGTERTDTVREEKRPQGPDTVLDPPASTPTHPPTVADAPGDAPADAPRPLRPARVLGATLATVAAVTALVVYAWPSGTYENPNPLGPNGPDAGSGAVACGPAGSAAIGADDQQTALVGHWTDDYRRSCASASLSALPDSSYGTAGTDFTTGRAAASVLGLPPADQAFGVRCANGHPVKLPVDVAPISVAYNVPGVERLVLSPSIIARIFDRRITTWNDPAIADLNPGRPLPDKDIAVFTPSENLSTTLGLTQYLSTTAPADWPYPPSATWPTGTHGPTRPTTDLAGQTLKTPFSISFLPLTSAALVKSAVLTTGPGGTGPVTPEPQAATKAAASAQVAGSGDNLTVSPNYGTTDGYPLIQIGYAVYCDGGAAGDGTGRALTGFLTHVVSESGQQTAERWHYGRLPAGLQKRVQDVLKAAPTKH